MKWKDVKRGQIVEILSDYCGGLKKGNLIMRCGYGQPELLVLKGSSTHVGCSYPEQGELWLERADFELRYILPPTDKA